MHLKESQKRGIFHLLSHSLDGCRGHGRELLVSYMGDEALALGPLARAFPG